MTLKEITDYCKENFPDSCLAYNYPENVSEGEYLLKELHDFFAFEIIGLCGCGSKEASEVDIRNILRVCSEEPASPQRKKALQDYFGVNSIYDSSLLQFMVYILNHVDLLEHGTSIGGSWITEFGKMCLYTFEHLELDHECKE